MSNDVYECIKLRNKVRLLQSKLVSNNESVYNELCRLSDSFEGKQVDEISEILGRRIIQLNKKINSVEEK